MKPDVEAPAQEPLRTLPNRAIFGSTYLSVLGLQAEHPTEGQHRLNRAFPRRRHSVQATVPLLPKVTPSHENHLVEVFKTQAFTSESHSNHLNYINGLT